VKIMPIYEYACRDCRDEFELLIRGDERPECPSCKSGELDRIPSVSAAHTKAARSSLPVCEPPRGGGCGLPQCGTGGCQGGMF
jgi:putative FmdB family regulatory protein